MPKLVTVTVEHSFGIKVKMPKRRYEMAEVVHAESRTYDVSDMGELAALEFANEKREELRTYLGDLALKEDSEITGYNLEDE